MKKIRIYTTFLLSLFTTFLVYSQQFNFIAEANKTEVAVGERFMVRFVLSTDQETVQLDDSVDLPSFGKLQVLSEYNTSNMQIANGRITNQLGKEVVLVANKEGTYTIGKASLSIAGKTYTTDKITIKVSESSQPQIPQGKRLKGAFLTSEVSNNNPFQNEGIILTVKLYARDYSILNRKRNYREPKFNGMMVKRVSEQPQDPIRHEIVNGTTFVSEELARYVVFPQETGDVNILPFSLEIIVSGYYGAEAVAITTEATELNVKPLPSGKPLNFKGAVGDYKISSTVDKTKIKANKSVTYEVELIGSGNINSVEIPKLEAPKEIEIYPPKQRNNYKARPSGLKGKITEEYVLVPQYGGEYLLKPITFSYFSPTEKKYKTIKTQEFNLMVDGPPIPKNNIKESNNTDSQNNVELNDHKATTENPKDSTFASSKLTKNIKGIGKKIENNNWILYILAALLPIGLLLLMIIKMRNKNKKTQPIKTSKNITDKEFYKKTKIDLQNLKQITKQNNSTEFYVEQENILTRVGQHISQLNLAEFSDTNVLEKLKNNYPADLLTQWQQLFLQAKQAKYTGQEIGGDLSQKFNETETIIYKILKHKP